MKKDQAFILHFKSLLNDLVNNHVGSLRCRAEEAHVKADYLLTQAEELLKKQKRMVDEVIEYCGGEDKFSKLLKEDFDSGHKKSCRWNEVKHDDEKV
jgi:hypothetical protein